MPSSSSSGFNFCNCIWVSDKPASHACEWMLNALEKTKNKYAETSKSTNCKLDQTQTTKFYIYVDATRPV